MGQHECPRPRLVEDSPLIWADVGVVLEVDRTASLDPMPRGPTLVVDFVEDHGVMKATRAQSPGGFLVQAARHIPARHEKTPVYLVAATQFAPRQAIRVRLTVQDQKQVRTVMPKTTPQAFIVP